MEEHDPGEANVEGSWSTFFLSFLSCHGGIRIS
jgi:hypothetical protein